MFGCLFEHQKTVVIFIRAYLRRSLTPTAQCGFCRSFLLWRKSFTGSQSKVRLTNGTRRARYGSCPGCGGRLTVPQAYVSHLASVPPETLAEIGVRVVVIGCGEWDVIPFYKGVGKHSSTSPELHPQSNVIEVTTAQKRLVSKEKFMQTVLEKPFEHLV
jgi:hypothetical protein